MPPQSPSSKAEAKRAFLIDQATRCLAQNGYAHVSLRDIAKASDVSLGILHYYFASKEDLLLAVISGYKDSFIQELESALLSDPLDGWLDRLLKVLDGSLTEQKAIHRLWYDLQVQAMYVPAFREQVNQIRTRMHDLITRMLEQLVHQKTLRLRISLDEAVSLIYAQVDGLFFQAMLEETSSAADVMARFERTLNQLLNLLFTIPGKEVNRDDCSHSSEPGNR